MIESLIKLHQYEGGGYLYEGADEGKEEELRPESREEVRVNTYNKETTQVIVRSA